MFQTSRKIFFIFIYLFSVSIGAFLSYTFFSFFIPLPVEIFFVIPLSYSVAVCFIFLFLSLKVLYFFKIFLSFLSFLLFLGVEIFVYINFRKISIEKFDCAIIFLSNGIFFLIDFFVTQFILNGFKKIDKVIENEAMFETKSQYIQWINDEYKERMDRLEPTWFIKLSTNIFVIFLVAAFLSIAKNSINRIFLSIALLLFVFSCVGMYLILYQYSSVVKWRFLGFKVKKEVISNWNRLIRVFLVFVVIVPILIPWNFVVFRLNFLTDFLSSLFPVIFKVNKQMTLENEVSTANQGNFTDNNIAERMEEFVRIAKNIILIFLLFYLFSAILGLIFKLVYRNKKIPFFAKIFIFCFDLFVSFLLKLKDFIKLIFETFIELFRGKKEKKVEEKLAKHFYKFFGEYKKLPSEKQKEIESIIKDFIKLIQVSSRFILPYSFYFGPKEYMDKVSEKVVESKTEINEVVGIFNESRYSLHLLSEEKKQRFRKLIDLIIDKITRMF